MNYYVESSIYPIYFNDNKNINIVDVTTNISDAII